MKGLTLTMEIVIIAIVLLVTALVIMTIFGGAIASVFGILNPWSETMMEQNPCSQRCAAWCQGHLGTASVEWTSSDMNVQTQSGPKSCATIMSGLGAQCSCRTITGGVCSMKCLQKDAGNPLEGQDGTQGCSTGKKCKVTCPGIDLIPPAGTTVTGACS